MSDIKLGRQDTSIREVLKEKNDCTVRALSEALEIGYLEAYGYLIGIGRARGKGVYCQSLYSSLAKNTYPRPGLSVENYVRLIANSGKWIIEIRGHVFAVINGEIRDTGYVEGNLKCHVKQAWRF